MKRLEHIDALRGLAILLVVFMHVPQYGWHAEIGGWYMAWTSLLAVPLFFFISGLVAHSGFTPRGKTYYKRIRALLVPTMLMAVACYVVASQLLWNK